MAKATEAAQPLDYELMTVAWNSCGATPRRFDMVLRAMERLGKKSELPMPVRQRSKNVGQRELGMALDLLVARGELRKGADKTGRTTYARK